MSSETRGRLVIRAIPDDATARKVAAYLLIHAAGATPEKVAARLASLPAVLAGSIEPEAGERSARELQELGADAQFIPNRAKAPQSKAHPVPHETTAGTHAQACAPPPGRGRGAAPRPERAAPTRRQQLHDLQILTGYGLLACLVAMASPLFYLVALPFALYAVHTAGRSLAVSGYLRALYLTCVFVPFANALVLLVLAVQATVALRRERGTTGSPADPAPGRLFRQAGFATLMVAALAGGESGVLPSSFSSLAESVETQLKRDVARSAKKFPMTVSKDVRIDNLTAGPDKLLTFNCTLVNVPASRIDHDRFHDTVLPSVTNEVCDGASLRQYLAKGVTVAYAFNGNDGNPVTTVTVTKADCGD